MISDEIKEKIKKFYSEKKYEEVIKFSEQFTNQDERPAGLINIIGLSYYQKKNPDEEDFNLALKSFELAYLKEKNSIHGLNALKNLIIVGIKSSILSKNFSKYLTKAREFFLESEKNFKDSEEFLKYGLLLFLHLLDTKKQKEIISKILNSNINSKYLRGLSTFMTNYHYDWSQKKIYECAKKNSNYYSKLGVKNLNEIDFKKNKKINIGFVSCDYEKNHSTTFFIKNTIKYLNKNKFKIFIFSLSKENLNDKSQNEIRNLSDEWFNCQDFDNQQIVTKIQDEQINILFDLIGYTNSERLEIFNSRVAPIQISWLAYCNTTGLKNVDYMIADKNLIHENEHHLYSEKIIKLPDIWNCHSGFNYQRIFNETPALNKSIFTFGSLNNFRKISDETVKVWSKILNNTPNSNLILKSSDFCSNDILLSKFNLFGVADKVKIFNKMDFLEKKDHLNFYNKIDLCLDTFPYNGVTTTFEALWMNVPVIVLKGQNFTSRCGESIILNSQLNHLIADNFDNYIDKAVFLNKNLNVLNELRKDLYNNVLSTPLFNSEKFAKNFSNALTEIL